MKEPTQSTGGAEKRGSGAFTPSRASWGWTRFTRVWSRGTLPPCRGRPDTLPGATTGRGDYRRTGIAAKWLLPAGLAVLAGGAWFIASVDVPPALLGPVPAETLTLLDSRGEPLAEIANAEARSQHPVGLAEMGVDLPRIVVALEDRRFYEHAGIDPRALLAAAGRDLRAGRIVSGASTITQQLVKLAAGRPGGRSLLVKGREAAAAWKLERRWTKEQILARYLNVSSYGNRLLGPEAAARAYFGKPARALSLVESIYLAGLPQAPSRLNPWRHPAAAEYRYQRSLRRLQRLGVLDGEQVRALADAPPRPGRFLPPRRAGHFVDLIVGRMRSAARGAESATGQGARVTMRNEETQHPAINTQRPASFSQPRTPHATLRTTLDPELQRVAETLLRRHLTGLNAADVTQGAVVIVENSSGAVRALVGSADYGDPRQGQVNGAARARSAGSTLKPFVYLTALDRRLLTAASILPDTAEAIRATYADYDPQNYFAGRHLGPVRVRQALGSSLNVPAVVALGRFVGARQAFYEAQRWGFRFAQPFDDLGAGFVLGNADIRLLDLAGAYAGLARGGVSQRPRLLAGESAPQERIASAEATAILTDILCDPEARRATFGTGSPLDFPDGVRVAVKTGTSSGFRDKWCVGFNARHTVAVWAGNFDGRPMGEAVAIHAAAPLWHALMEHLLVERGDGSVPAATLSEKLVRREICPLTGLLPAPDSGSPPMVPELFLAGTEPTASAAGSFVAGADGRPHLRLPAEYGVWCSGPQNVLGAVAEDPRSLAILSPPDGANYRLDPEMPTSQQMVEFTTNVPDRARVRWTVDGELLPPHEDGRVFWPLRRGNWTVEAAVLPDPVEGTSFRPATAGSRVSVE